MFKSGFNLLINRASLIFLLYLLEYPFPKILKSFIQTRLCFVFFEWMRICDFSSFLLCCITRFCNLQLVSPVYWDEHFLFGHVAWYTTLCKCFLKIDSSISKHDETILTIDKRENYSSNLKVCRKISFIRIQKKWIRFFWRV